MVYTLIQEIGAKYLLRLDETITAAGIAWGNLSDKKLKTQSCAECLKEFRGQHLAFSGLFLIHHIDHTSASDERMRYSILCHIVSFHQGHFSMTRLKHNEDEDEEDDGRTLAMLSCMSNVNSCTKPLAIFSFLFPHRESVFLLFKKQEG